MDGISILPTLTGKPELQKKHDYLYWEYSEKQAVRTGDWKAYRKSKDSAIELYNLKEDVGERTDLSDQRSGIVNEVKEIMRKARTESELFPLVRERKE